MQALQSYVRTKIRVSLNRKQGLQDWLRTPRKIEPKSFLAYKGKDNFVATQWPLEDTVVDFWRLIKDHDVQHIVLLEELSMKKSVTVQNINVVMLKTPLTNQSIIDVRSKLGLSASSTSTNCTVVCTYVNIVTPVQCLTLHHCRDGAKLCGLFIAALNILDMVDAENEVDVFYGVQQIKVVRPEFVQSQEQFFSCTTSLRHTSNKRSIPNLNRFIYTCSILQLLVACDNNPSVVTAGGLRSSKSQSQSSSESDRYKGCYEDKIEDGRRALEILAYKVDGNGVNSNGICLGNCSRSEYTFAGTQAGTECWCGNNYDYDRYGPYPEECTRECRNHANETCGGNWRSQTYSVCPTGKYKGEGNPVINDEPNCQNECHCTELPCLYIEGTCTDGCAIGWRADDCNERDCEVENGGCQHQCTEDERDEWCSCDDGFEIPDEDWRNCIGTVHSTIAR
ncbi:hypothetical protein CAPTEDRAFT_199909 [Capitella teleta]|uniref:WSC domain-containing protein n=1 Tax=Capitella teleta TaxID=283909 RepID=R7V788_CAPTE|nr:hypothetical protein CAPTEDRAFT_199909 [Capitella teleta]|eukprot:ELU12231.1 hypothetical protein CAPTEDRAFT_199909 [Capitella teleta]